MAKFLVMIALMLLVVPGCATAKNRTEAGVVQVDAPEMHDKAKDDACDCCQKCSAAKSTIKSKEEETESVKGDSEKGGVENDGCEDCCTRCGKELQPRSQEAPPEIIKKEIPPEIKGK